MRATTKLLTVLAMAAALAPMAPASAAVTDAAIADFAFSPNPVNVKVGDTVKWTNSDSSPHTVTADNGSFESDSLSNGGTFSQTFNQAGTFAYHCEIHPTMQGTVQVAVQSTTTTAAPTTTAPPTTVTTAPATTATAPPTTPTTRATTTSTAPRSTTTAPRPTTTATWVPARTTSAMFVATPRTVSGATPMAPPPANASPESLSSTRG